MLSFEKYSHITKPHDVLCGKRRFLIVLAVALLGLAGCDNTSSGPDEELVISEVNEMLSKVPSSFGHKFKDHIQINDVKVSDRRLEGDRAIIITEVTFTCLQEWPAKSTVGNDLVNRYLGEGECRKGLVRKGEITTNFTKFESGWRPSR